MAGQRRSLHQAFPAQARTTLAVPRRALMASTSLGSKRGVGSAIAGGYFFNLDAKKTGRWVGFVMVLRIPNTLLHPWETVP